MAGPREREPRKRRPNVARLEVVPVAELKTRLSAKLMPLVEEYKDKLAKLAADVGGSSSSRRAMIRRISERR
jgi:hypothetical protein